MSRFTAINLSGLTPPDIIETLDYEAIVKDMRDDLVARFPLIAGVIDLVKRQAAAKKGLPVNEEQLTMMKQMLAGKVEHESSCWQATGRLFDDGVIDPRDTRTVLLLALSAIHNAPVRGTAAWGTFRH